MVVPWELLDQNAGAASVVAARGNLYQWHNDGTVWRYTGPPITGWQLIDNYPNTVAITAAGTNLYQLHNDGSVWRYTGTPMKWDLINDNRTTVAITAAGTNLYQLRTDGGVWRYTGTPKNDWEPLGQDLTTLSIAAAGDALYQLRKNGSVWRYSGTPKNDWEQLDENPACTQIAAAADNLYQLHDNGKIWRFTGTPFTGWELLDQNPAGTQIAATGDNLYQLHDTGSVWRYTGPPVTGWAQLGDNAATQIAADGDALYQIEVGSGRIWRAGEPAKLGRWDPVMRLPNVPIHTNVLPDGTVLFWGRRDRTNDSMNEHECTAHVWNPVDGKVFQTPQPTQQDGTKINIFCAGHAFLPDGRLLAAGGHLVDNDGIEHACIYDHRENTWTPIPPMNNRRWYPTATTLPDGTILVLSGSYINYSLPERPIVIDDVPQIWDGHDWRSLTSFYSDPDKRGSLLLYPRVHVMPDGRVFMSGPGGKTYVLDTTGEGTWTELGARQQGLQDYAPSVMYEPGKIVYIGGGNGPDWVPPVAGPETIDLNAERPTWRPAAPMKFRRRQHNGTILPDGTILVTGGTQGPGFNDLRPGSPIHAAELYDPVKDTWTMLAAESVDRCYHSTTILLPDATLLSAGGGEFAVAGWWPNDDKDTYRNGQIFHPPYLFHGPRPVIESAPGEVDYGETFTVDVSGPDVGRVSWIRLGSVTHAFDENQLANVLRFEQAGSRLTVTAPERAQLSPPGHYMLFVLSADGVPSVARILRIGSPVPTPAPRAMTEAAPEPSVEEQDEQIRARSTGTKVTVGLTAQCPYGLGACWGGASEALQELDGVAAVPPIPDAENSTADVYLHDQGLPDLDRWPEQFAHWANRSYDFRGVEVVVAGTVLQRGGTLRLSIPAVGTPLTLMPLDQATKLQWNHHASRAQNLTDDERSAYSMLAERYRSRADGDVPVSVTGPLTRADGGWTLHVREFGVVEPG